MEQTLLDALPMSPLYCWLAIGGMFLLLEASGVNGIGLLFGGIAALCVAGAVEAEWITPEAIVTQSGIWFGLTILIAAALYGPLKRWRTSSSSGQSYDNMIGTHATVATGGLMLGKPGKVHWSGTTMNAQIDSSSSKEAFLQGDDVVVAAMRGNQLLVIDPSDPLPPST